ncbi:Golgi to ER traffic protein [Acrasis kona]|uniref:Golgi to ER traffic protein n=1 Tax=Acrasis kona TaxID=1008807 RepID=A0AAW2YNL0_9EUKA
MSDNGLHLRTGLVLLCVYLTIGYFGHQDARIDWRLRMVSPIYKTFFLMAGMYKGMTFSRTVTMITQIPVRTTDGDYNGVKTTDVLINNFHKDDWRGNNNDIVARVFEPKNLLPCSDEKLPLMIYYHGGGYATCSSRNILFDSLLRELSYKLKVIIVAADYALAPEHPFPAALYDTCSTWRWVNELHNQTLARNASFDFAYRIDFNRIIVAGDSAGGNLAFRQTFLARDKQEPIYPAFAMNPSAVRNLSSHLKISYQILISPGTGTIRNQTDIEKSYLLNEAVLDWFWASSIGDIKEQQFIDSVVDSEFCICPKKMCHKGLPDALVISGCMDPLYRDAKEIAKNMNDAGVNATMIIYNTVHSFHVFQFLEESQDAYNQIERALFERGLTGHTNCKIK